MKLLTATEKRRRDQEALSQSVRSAEIRLPGLPPMLITTDRVLSRWGCEGSGMPSEDPDAYRDSLPPPLDPATYVIVNRIVTNAERHLRRFAIDFYRSYNPALALAKNWSQSPREIRRIRVRVLQEFRELFLRSKHPDLIALVRFIPEDEVDPPPNLP